MVRFIVFTTLIKIISVKSMPQLIILTELYQFYIFNTMKIKLFDFYQLNINLVMNMLDDIFFNHFITKPEAGNSTLFAVKYHS